MKHEATMRAYKANLAVTTHSGVSIQELSAAADGLIDRLARAHDVGRSIIAKQLIEDQIERDPEGAAAVVIARIGKPKARQRRTRVLRRMAIVRDVKPSVRAQDSVCRDLHGAIPAGGCRYPNCKCKV
jgi:hypothetical protein